MAKGVRDFGPEEKIERDRIVQILKRVFESFGYNPIETPVLERYELFASKYGIGMDSDAMRETFKLKDQGGRDLVLRTEFTVPFSRFVAMNPQLRKPFKRYQMGTVFRDGPIKLGRYREFWQCDVDVVGVGNPAIDAEILQLAQEAFSQLGLEVEIRINNRKILNGILQYAGVSAEAELSAIIAIDKLDKIGPEGVKTELQKRGVADKSIDTIVELITIQGSNNDIITKLRAKLGDNEGLREVERTIRYVVDDENILVLPSLARGLAYYTGNVFEVYLKNRATLSSSVGAGGRYDEMIAGFLKSNQPYPAVGISFGLETIFDAIKLLKQDGQSPKSVVQVYISPFSQEYIPKAMEIAAALRRATVRVDVDYLSRKLKKNLEHASVYQIPWVVILGDNEIEQEKVMLRNMRTGEQALLAMDEVIKTINK